MSQKGLIIIPACNEEVSLREFLPRLMLQVAESGTTFEIFLVDDGSTDATSTVAKSHGCRVSRNATNVGVGESIRQGYAFASAEEFDVAFVMDADGQHDPALLPELLGAPSRADFVIASRYHPASERHGVPLDRDLLNIATTAMIETVTGWNLTDPLSGFWGTRRDIFRFLLAHTRQPRYGVNVEALVKLWYLVEPRPKFEEVPHPAIYQNHGGLSLLTRTYSPDNREVRVERFGTHANHILEAIDDVKKIIGPRVDDEIEQRRAVRRPHSVLS